MSYNEFKIYTKNYLRLIESSLMPDTAAVVIVRNNKALILQRGYTAPWMPGKWNLPGGGIDQGEAPIQAAKREAVEETSIDLTSYNLVTISVDDGGGWVLETFITKIPEHVELLPDRNHHKYEEDQAKRQELLPISKEIGIPESKDYAWISIQELDKYEFVPMVKENIRKALQI